MHFYNYVECLFAGAFLTNAIPHFVQGISGNKFPTPFAKPHGKGLSPPILNVWWGLFNMVAGLLLVTASHISKSNVWTVVAFFTGMAGMSTRLSLVFAKKDKE